MLHASTGVREIVMRMKVGVIDMQYIAYKRVHSVMQKNGSI